MFGVLLMPIRILLSGFGFLILVLSSSSVFAACTQTYEAAQSLCQNQVNITWNTVSSCRDSGSSIIPVTKSGTDYNAGYCYDSSSVPPTCPDSVSAGTVTFQCSAPSSFCDGSCMLSKSGVSVGTTDSSVLRRGLQGIPTRVKAVT